MKQKAHMFLPVVVDFLSESMILPVSWGARPAFLCQPAILFKAKIGSFCLIFLHSWVKILQSF